MDEDECCYNCRYWFSKGIAVNGENQTHYFCRRFPPVAGTGFPETQSDDWCGEWKTFADENP